MTTEFFLHLRAKACGNDIAADETVLGAADLIGKQVEDQATERQLPVVLVVAWLIGG